MAPSSPSPAAGYRLRHNQRREVKLHRLWFGRSHHVTRGSALLRSFRRQAVLPLRVACVVSFADCCLSCFQQEPFALLILRHARLSCLLGRRNHISVATTHHLGIGILVRYKLYPPVTDERGKQRRELDAGTRRRVFRHFFEAALGCGVGRYRHLPRHHLVLRGLGLVRKAVQREGDGPVAGDGAAIQVHGLPLEEDCVCAHLDLGEGGHGWELEDASVVVQVFQHGLGDVRVEDDGDLRLAPAGGRSH